MGGQSREGMEIISSTNLPLCVFFFLFMTTPSNIESILMFFPNRWQGQAPQGREEGEEGVGRGRDCFP